MIPHRHPIRSVGIHASAALFAVVLCTFGDVSVGNAQTWVDRRVSGPFVCQSEFPLTAWEGLLEELTQLQDDLVRCLGVPPAREPIRLYFFRSKRSYARFLKQHFPGIPYRRALYIKGQGPGEVYTYRSQEFVTDVRHECTHALLHAVMPVVPLWLDEGLAEYFEVSSDDQAFDNPHLAGLRWNLWFGMLPHLESLEKMDDLSEMGGPEYRDAWAWVHFMLHGPKEAHAELVGYIADIRANAPPERLSRRLNRRLRSPYRDLANHFKHWKR